MNEGKEDVDSSHGSSNSSSDSSDDEKKKKKEKEKEKENNKFDFLPEPNDLTSGLIVSQGHWVFHLSMYFMLFFVEEAKDPLMCYEVEEDGNFKQSPKDCTLNANFKIICTGHLIIAILLNVSEIIRTFSLAAHFTTFLQMISVFLYQLIIVLAMQTVEESNQLVLKGCLAYDMGSTMQWLRIEVSIFYVNLVVLILYLVRAVLVRDIRDMERRVKEENKDIIEHIGKKIDKFGEDLSRGMGYDEPITLIFLEEDDETAVKKTIKMIENKIKELDDADKDD